MRKVAPLDHAHFPLHAIQDFF